MIEPTPVSIALLPADITLLVHLVRQEYRSARTGTKPSDVLYASQLKRFLRRLGDNTPIEETGDA